VGVLAVWGVLGVIGAGVFYGITDVLHRQDAHQYVGALSRQLTPDLPDPVLTPGDVFPVTKDDVCVPGYSKVVRNVPKSLREEAFRRYGIPFPQPDQYELDHLIPLSIGGSNSIRNLWPQAYNTSPSPWNAHVKDGVERRLHDLVCSDQIDLKDAQHAIATDW